jgi:ABC-2 type transport system permease protein
MSSRFWLATSTLWHREMIHFWRERNRVLGFAASPLLLWLVIGSGFGDLAFFFPGALLLSVVFTAVFATMSVIEDRKEGFLLSVLASPAPRGAIVAGKVLGGATMAAVQGLLFFIALPPAGIYVSLLGVLESALVLFLVGIAFTSMGFWLAWRSRTSQGFHAIMNLVLMPLWMMSGALFPTAKSHGWIRALMTVNPMTYSLAALRHAMGLTGGEANLPSFGVSLGVTAAFAVLFIYLSIRSVEDRRTDIR